MRPLSDGYDDLAVAVDQTSGAPPSQFVEYPKFNYWILRRLQLTFNATLFVHASARSLNEAITSPPPTPRQQTQQTEGGEHEGVGFGAANKRWRLYALNPDERKHAKIITTR